MNTNEGGLTGVWVPQRQPTPAWAMTQGSSIPITLSYLQTTLPKSFISLRIVSSEYPMFSCTLWCSSLFHAGSQVFDLYAPQLGQLSLASMVI